MNVMTQAHKTVKDAIKAQVELGNGRTHTYAQMLSLALKLAHKEFKAMQEANPFVQMVEDCKVRIAQLEAIENRDGYIVVIGADARLPVKEHSNGWSRVENASIFWHVEDANYLASRVVNGKGENGVVVKKIDQINWEIAEQKKLLEHMEEYLSR